MLTLNDEKHISGMGLKLTMKPDCGEEEQMWVLKKTGDVDEDDEEDKD